MSARRPLLTATLLLGMSSPLWAAKQVDLDYRVKFLPETDQAEVSLTLEKGEVVQKLAFTVKQCPDDADAAQHDAGPAGHVAQDGLERAQRCSIGTFNA